MLGIKALKYCKNPNWVLKLLEHLKSCIIDSIHLATTHCQSPCHLISPLCIYIVKGGIKVSILGFKHKLCGVVKGFADGECGGRHAYGPRKRGMGLMSKPRLRSCIKSWGKFWKRKLICFVAFKPRIRKCMNVRLFWRRPLWNKHNSNPNWEKWRL